MRFLSPMVLLCCVAAGRAVPADITVAKDGSGDFTTIEKAVQSIPKTNRQRMVVFIKPGIYEEKVRIDAPFVTLRGQDRQSTRIEYPQLEDDFNKHPDDLGKGVVNVNGDDCIIQDLTIYNSAGKIGPHAFAVYGTADRTVILDSNIFSEGADTLSLWKDGGGRYYHARCNFRGSADYVCPRGWCYITDCTFYACKVTASNWLDGSGDKDKKFVLHNCQYDGFEGFFLARHHVDAQFYYLECSFSKNMADKAPYRVTYPTDGSKPTLADIQKNKDNDAKNIWGDRAYFFNCKRDGKPFDWFKNNLETADGSPTADQITAAWTFAGKWDPESTAGPKTIALAASDDQISVTFSEPVTVKGKPRLALADGGYAEYSSGSGGDTLIFKSLAKASGKPTAVVSNGALIIASEASATPRAAELDLNAPPTTQPATTQPAATEPAATQP